MGLDKSSEPAQRSSSIGAGVQRRVSEIKRDFDFSRMTAVHVLLPSVGRTTKNKPNNSAIGLLSPCGSCSNRQRLVSAFTTCKVLQTTTVE